MVNDLEIAIILQRDIGQIKYGGRMNTQYVIQHTNINFWQDNIIGGIRNRVNSARR